MQSESNSDCQISQTLKAQWQEHAFFQTECIVRVLPNWLGWGKHKRVHIQHNFLQALCSVITSAPDGFHRTVQQLFDGMDGVVAFPDDVLVWGTRKQPDKSLRKMLAQA